MKQYRATAWYVPKGRTEEVRECFTMEAESEAVFESRLAERLKTQGATNIQVGPATPVWRSR